MVLLLLLRLPLHFYLFYYIRQLCFKVVYNICCMQSVFFLPVTLLNFIVLCLFFIRFYLVYQKFSACLLPFKCFFTTNTTTTTNITTVFLCLHACKATYVLGCVSIAINCCCKSPLLC